MNSFGLWPLAFGLWPFRIANRKAQSPKPKAQFAICNSHFAIWALVFVVVGCSDDRTAPTQTNEPVYSKTFVLFDRDSAAGATLSRSFTLRDSITDARLVITGFLPDTTRTPFLLDSALSVWLQLAGEVDALIALRVAIDKPLDSLSKKSDRTHADSLKMESLRALLQVIEDMTRIRESRSDAIMANYDGHRQLVLYERLGGRIAGLKEELLRLEGQILNIIIKPTPEQDLLALDSLVTLKFRRQGEMDAREVRREVILDSYLDDQFKVSIRLDADSVELYPRAIYLDSTAVPRLQTDQVIWGQGFFLSPADKNGWRGKKMTLDLKQFMIADSTYRSPEKPDRPGNPEDLPELLPVINWFLRLTPGDHTIHIRFGAPGTQTELTASLYVVYATAGR